MSGFSTHARKPYYLLNNLSRNQYLSKSHLITLLYPNYCAFISIYAGLILQIPIH